jgi:hypothetical protein
MPKSQSFHKDELNFFRATLKPIFASLKNRHSPMSDAIKHECGIALLRLKKPLQFYTEKYGTAFYGLNKMYLLMQKQHHRGQDGAGLANIKLEVEPGKKIHQSNSFQ